MTTTSLVDDVRRWIAEDPDGTTRAALESLLATATPALSRRPDGTGRYDPAVHADAEAALAELRDRFSGPLEFGTDGLHGRLGAGPHRMNRAVVLRAAAGLTRWLQDEVTAHPLVVIGYDARRGSARFAHDTAAVVVAAAGSALLLPGPLPTPLLAFAVQHLRADAGVMVTASHHPAEDSGYKVYLGGRSVPAHQRGAPIAPPVAGAVARHIAAAPPARRIPRATQGWVVLGEELREAYLARLRTHVAHPDRGAETVPGPLRIVITPMHGVGGETAVRALAGGGFTDVHLVPRQALPDPDFPTLPHPDPEQAGALDLAQEFASTLAADLVLAVDPDAGRCSAAVPTAGGGWRRLSGDELAGLLGEQAAVVLSQGRPSTVTGGRTLARSLDSSRLLARIATEYGVDHAVTLPGFPWVSRAAGLAFGVAEDVGFCVDPERVRDKDGISACLRTAQLADSLRRRGSSLVQALDAQAVRHGVHHTARFAIRVADLSLVALAMERLRTTPPAALAGASVTRVVDLAEGSDRLPPTDGLEFRTDAGDRAVVRPSGAGPVVACSLEVVEPVDGGPPAVPAARARAEERLAALRADVATALRV